jgi:hypothetical protein
MTGRWTYPHRSHRLESPTHSQRIGPTRSRTRAQSARRDPVGHLARDYEMGAEESEHRIARSVEDLRDIVEALTVSENVLAAVQSATAEWTSHT